MLSRALSAKSPAIACTMNAGNTISATARRSATGSRPHCSVLVSTLQWGLLPVADRRAVALIVFPAFIVQAIAGLFALSARDSIAGTLMLSFATTWLIDALVFFVNPPGAAAALGVL